MDDEALQKQLGERARAARVKLKLSQAAVAQRMGLNANLYGRIERGELMPSVPTARCIAAELGLSLDELLAMEPPPRKGAGRGGTSAGGKALAPEFERLLDAVRKWPPARVEAVTALLRQLERSWDERLERKRR